MTKTKILHKTKKQPAYHFNRQQRRVMLQEAARLERKRARLQGPDRIKCLSCNLLFLSSAQERCQCKSSLKRYEHKTS